ncbi:hypothetical protein COV61_04340 [Candidatus Micrarchaeota archaeon CG11_big_fil_rev_8_21_14_0_20_47_5]|nr:MAG: hypothetical protein AUJ17_02605 [Candidatus Micrarchaeota archaeon CG1_02_47_40]PIN83016.1 MAG: hypothetical protein COV61_04340 [Candidatus Micrarchaeota archaeon CG11_big_fil_rev_8_21_14_0_20_47_5]
MKELYAKEITDSSLKELEEMARWYNEKIGNYPIIVGGWAVYFYIGGLGSKDIDVVFLGDRAKDATLAAYFHSHGYAEKRRDFFDKEYVKKVKAGDREIEIIIDAVSAKRTILFDGKDARIPWSLAAKHNVERKIGSASVCLPTKELLLTYKLGAVLGRSILLKTSPEFDYYRSKLWKDVYDAASLAGLKIEQKTVWGFLGQTGLKKYAKEIMQIIEANFDEEAKSLAGEEGFLKIRGMLGEDWR